MDGAYALILQPDGKLVAAGHAHYRNDFGLARYNPDGSLDPTFGDAGRVTTYLHGGAYALVLQPDGKLVAAGYAFYSLYDYYDFALVRYNPNGSLDTRFDDDGILTTDFFGGDDYAYAVVVQPDGKLIAAGGAGYNYGYDFPDFALARYAGEGFFYNPNGQFEWLAQGQVATDTFTYIVSDGALTDTATVSITVTGVDDAPAAVDDAYSMGEDTVLAVPAPGLLANDSDPENDPLSAALGSPPAQGALALAADGGFVFTPTLDFTGLVTFTYVVSDGILTDTAAVSITVFPNTAPVVQAGPDQAVAEGQVVAFTGSYTDTGQLSVISDQLPVTSRQEIIVVTAFVVTWDFGDGTGVTGTLTPTHAYGDDGVYTVTLVVTDAWGAAGMDTLVVTASNAAPALAPLADQNTILGQALTVTVAYSDPGWLDTHTAALDWGDGLTATLELSAGLGSFEATHIYALAGSYTATITLADDDGGQDALAFTVTVDPFTFYLPLILHLLAPVAVDDFGPGFITDEDTPFTLADVLANDYDPNGNLLSIEGFDASAATGLVSFVPGGPAGALDPTFDGDQQGNS